MTDTQVPTLEGIKQIGPRQFDLTFSEPVKKGSNFDVQIKQESNIYTVVGLKSDEITKTLTVKKATLTVGKIKLTLTFSKIDGKDNFTTNPTGNLKVMFAADAAETDLGTTKGVEKVEFTFTEELDAVTKYSFEVEGFKVDTAEVQDEKVVLTLNTADQDEDCHLDKVTVRQVGKIADKAENELKDFSAEAKVFEAAPAATTLKIDYATEKVTGFNALTMEVANDAAFENKIADFDGTIAPGQTIYARVKATSNAEAGAVQTITAGARPTGLTAGALKITGATASTVYEVKLADEEWVEKTANESGEIAVEAAGNYTVRLKATSSDFASEVATVNSVTE